METLNFIAVTFRIYIRNVKYSNKHLNIKKGESLATSVTGTCEINL